MAGAEVIQGDCLDVLGGIAPSTVDSVVTDPPYGLEFMGKGWDKGVPGDGHWRAVKDTLRPGGYMLAMGGTRTWHRLAAAIEDAGFELRDSIMWLHSQPFDLVCNCDSAAGGPVPHTNGVCASHRPRPPEQRADEPRTVAGQSQPQTRRGGTICNRCGKPTVMPWGWPEGLFAPYLAWNYGSGFPKGKGCLKPAWEPVLLCRKPGKRVEPLGIDACRVPCEPGDRADRPVAPNGVAKFNGSKYAGDDYSLTMPVESLAHPAGRWPANVAHDGSDEVLAAFAAFGERGGGFGRAGGKVDHAAFGGGMKNRGNQFGHGDTGTAARFFYCAKASRKERGEGNGHPTVKPLALMRWLCKLVTPPGGLVLDPFAGSGTTGVAAVECGFRFMGIEKEAAYVEIARRRIAEAEAETPLFAGVA